MTAFALAAARGSRAPGRRFEMPETGDPIEMERPHGRFKIATAGWRPEAPHAFLYEDASHRFFFYAELVPLPVGYEIDVNSASASHFSGPNPHVPIADRFAIAENIRLFFNKRNFACVEDELSVPEHQPRKINFKWVLEP